MHASYIQLLIVFHSYQEQEVLVMQAKSPIHLSRVISHRQRLLAGKNLFKS